MRAIWKGAVSFGLVNVPVRLYSATENHDVQFRQVHREDGGRIKYQRVCSIDGEQVAYDDIAKGYETEDGQMVVLTDEDLAELPVSSSREIAVEKFVPADQIDPMLLEKSYYLEPDKAAAKPYALLRDALKEADRMAVVTVSIRTRMTIAVLRVRDDVIVMQTMLWPDEVRKPELRRASTRRRERRQAGRAEDGQHAGRVRWPATTTRTSTRTTTQQAVEARGPRQARGRRGPAGRRRRRGRVRRGRRPARGPAAQRRAGQGRPRRADRHGRGRRRRPATTRPTTGPTTAGGAGRKPPARKAPRRRQGRREEGRAGEEGGRRQERAGPQDRQEVGLGRRQSPRKKAAS